MSQRLRSSFLRGYVMAKKRSMVTDSVMNTEPTRPMCAKPYLECKWCIAVNELEIFRRLGPRARDFVHTGIDS